MCIIPIQAVDKPDFKTNTVLCRSDVRLEISDPWAVCEVWPPPPPHLPPPSPPPPRPLWRVGGACSILWRGRNLRTWPLTVVLRSPHCRMLLLLLQGSINSTAVLSTAESQNWIRLGNGLPFLKGVCHENFYLYFFMIRTHLGPWQKGYSIF